MSTSKKNYASKVTFMTIAKFKKMIGSDNIEIVYNANTSKRSVLDTDSDTFYRCQLAIDPSKPMAFLIEEGKGLDEACLVNVSGDGQSPLTTEATL